MESTADMRRAFAVTLLLALVCFMISGFFSAPAFVPASLLGVESASCHDDNRSFIPEERIARFTDLAIRAVDQPGWRLLIIPRNHLLRFPHGDVAVDHHTHMVPHAPASVRTE